MSANQITISDAQMLILQIKYATGKLEAELVQLNNENAALAKENAELKAKQEKSAKETKGE
jgi:hypothetical protein